MELVLFDATFAVGARYLRIPAIHPARMMRMATFPSVVIRMFVFLQGEFIKGGLREC
jgi:hypothetical protein